MPAAQASPVVSNSAFLQAMAHEAPKGSTLWVCGFIGSPDLTDASNWTGHPYNPASHSKAVDSWGTRNSYFSVAAIRPSAEGEYRRRKANFARLLALVADDVEIQDLQGQITYVLQTSPGKSQVGVFIDRADPDAADLALVGAVMQAMSDKGFVRLDSAGNNAVRYVRLPVGSNLKPRDTGPFAHQMSHWKPSCVMSLADACSVFGIELDDCRSKAPREQQPNTGRQDEKLRVLTANILRGSELHDSVNGFVASLVASGTKPGAAVNITRSLMDASSAPRDERFQARYLDIPRAVSTAIEKFKPEDEEEQAPVPPSETWADVVQAWTPPSDLLTRSTAIEWDVEGWIQRGKVGALVAAGGTGKTTLLITLGICIALGRPWFGQRVRQGTFLLLSNDDPQEDLEAALVMVMRALELSPQEMAQVTAKFRIVSLIGRLGDKVFTAVGPGAVVSPTLMLAMLLQATEGISDIAMVALDTLRQFAGGSTNDEQVIKLTIGACTEFTAERKCSVILPHHTGKQNFREKVTDMYAGSGSAAIADNCRFILLLQEASWSEINDKVQRTGQEDGSPLVLTSTRGSLRVKAPDPMFLARDGYRIERIGGELLSHDAISDKRDREILEAVRAGAGSKNAIVAAVGGKRISVFARIDDLIHRGHITTDGSHRNGGKGTTFVVSETGSKLLWKD